MKLAVAYVFANVLEGTLVLIYIMDKKGLTDLYVTQIRPSKS